MTQLVFAHSTFWPLAIGFFGLATGYFVWGGQALFGFPKATPEVDKSVALWGLLNGFMQFITGILLIVGLTWFGVFNNAAPLYMAALAFTAYGVHWFVLGARRFIGASEEPEAWMAIAFVLLSLLGTIVFFSAGDVPAGILFIGLTLVYATEIVTRFDIISASRWVGLWQFLTGIWLMYLTFGVTLNASLGAHWWV